MKKKKYLKRKSFKKRFPRWTRPFLVFAYLFLVGFGFFFSFYLVISPTLPDVDDIERLMAAQSSVIYDRKGEVLYTIHGEENRKIVPLSQISQRLIEATLAIEDDRFYNHFGLDFAGIAMAICGEVRLCARRGGSTITQQFAKNAFLSSERTYVRKIKEAFLALQLERRFSKNEILEMYLNRINYGSNIYGVELAAKVFFNKSAQDLDLLESAILAAIPKAPTYFSPYGTHQYATINLSEEEILRRDIRSEKDLIKENPEFITKGLLGKTYSFGEGRSIYVKGRVDFVLERMEELDMITPEEKKGALFAAETKMFNQFRDSIRAPHFVLYIRELLEEKYGKEALEKGGFKITTTLDWELQKAAEETIGHYANHNQNKYGASNASLVTADPQTGQILAMVGSRDFWNDEIDGKVNIALRPRLPGSAFKPIVYAAAFLQGYAPSTVLYDVKTKFGGWYAPDNFDGTFMGPISMRIALAHSRNIPAVKTAQLAGIPNILDLARKMGIALNQPDDWYGLSLALGAGEVPLLDMVLAYSVFASGGYKVEPVAILKVEDRNANILEEYEPPEERELILDPQAAYLINHVLSDVQARPEGFWRDRHTLPGQINAAKTGTSNKEKKNPAYNPSDPESREFIAVPSDAWAFGYTTSLVTGVWAGNSDGSPLKDYGGGVNTASPIWYDTMVKATQGQPMEHFERPEGIRFIKVSKRSGKLPSEFTSPEDVTTEVFASFSVPRELDNSYEEIEIDRVSGKLATDFTPTEAREKKGFFRHQELIDDPNWAEGVTKWTKENAQADERPTEYDDVHHAETALLKPEIRLVSPTAESLVSPPYIGVVSEVDSSRSIAKVEYYWDDRLVETATDAPYRARFKISERANKRGSTHTLKAVVLDQLFYSDQDSIEVEIGEDTAPPEIRFTSPEPGQTLTSGEVITAQLEAYDPNGDVKSVELYLDDAPGTILRAAPYLWSFQAPETPGEHKLKAIASDFGGNQAEAEILFQVTQETAVLTGVTRILSPEKNQIFEQGKPVFIKAYLDEATRSQLQELVLLAKPAGQVIPLEIAKIARDTEVGFVPLYNFIWEGAAASSYELSLKLVFPDEKIRFSEKVPILVR